jgi:PAC2 family
MMPVEEGTLLDPRSLMSTNAELFDSPALRGLDLIMGFTGAAEAGHVVEQIGDELLDELDAQLVAAFDADQLVDYRSRRPKITFAGDHFTDYEAPAIELYRLVDGLGTPFLLLTGPEPDYQWDRFSGAVVWLANRLQTRLVAWVQSLPMPVPHTRPIGVTVHGSRQDLINGLTTWKPQAELQAGIGPLLEMRLAEAGRDVVGYSIHVPHYLADAQYPPAAVAALEYLGAATSLMLPTDRLRENGRDVEGQIDRQVQDSADVQRVVVRLEERYDEYAGHEARRSLLVKDNEELPDADELGAAVEAFLATQPATGDDGGKGPSAEPGTTD